MSEEQYSRSKRLAKKNKLKHLFIKWRHKLKKDKSDIDNISTSRNNKVTKQPRVWWKTLLLIGLYLFMATFIAGASLFMYYAINAPTFDEEKLNIARPTQIYDVNGALVAEIGATTSEVINYENIPNLSIDAITSIEDARFFEHNGLDFKRLAGATISNLTEGFGSEGASTITQQVVKLSFLTTQKSLERKAQEAYLSFQLEQNYSKQAIFTMYVNKIYYSDGVYGLQTAAKYYYDKNVDELSLAEMALLAGIPQSPNNYNPYDYPDNAKTRRDTVINAMVRFGKITEQQAEEAKNTPIEAGLVPRDESNRFIADNKFDARHAAYIDQVVKELQANDNLKDETNVLNRGLKVYTNLDVLAQENIATILNDDSYGLNPNAQASIAILDTKTGAILALGGGKNYQYGNFNFATQGNSQMGSSIKPILDYGPAIEYLSWGTDHQVSDEPYTIAGTNIEIYNWDRLNHGNVSIRYALQQSLNLPAIRTFEQVGFEQANKFSSQLGINMTYDGVTSAIGGGEDIFSILQATAAFTSFGNGGEYHQPFAINKVVNIHDEEITGFGSKDSHTAMKDSTAYILTDMLRGVLSYNGTAPNAAVPGLDLAGKSGTTTFDNDIALKYGFDINDAAKDSWFIGYSTNYTIGVWQGFDKIDDAGDYLSPSNTTQTQMIFSELMANISSNVDTPAFEQPNSVVEVNGELYPDSSNEIPEQGNILTNLFNNFSGRNNN